MERAVALLCLCTVLLASPARAQLRYYGSSMLDCAQKAGLTYTVQAMQVAPEIFSNQNLEATFFAMDNNNWVTLGKYQNPPLTPAQMLADKGFVSQILKNHVLGRIFPTANWPSKVGYSYGQTYQSVGVAQLLMYVDYKYTYRVGGWMGSNQVACSMSNLQCGSGVMHVVTDSWDSVPK